MHDSTLHQRAFFPFIENARAGMTIKLFGLFFLEKCGLSPVATCMLVSSGGRPGGGLPAPPAESDCPSPVLSLARGSLCCARAGMTIKLFGLFFLEECGLSPVATCMLGDLDGRPGSARQQHQRRFVHLLRPSEDA